jgi:ribosomal protein S18 acetylase RimI-like enzyme
MNSIHTEKPQDEAAVLEVVVLEALNRHDMDDLCAGTIGAIESGEGFMWLKPPARKALEHFWKGVLLIPDRTLFIGRLNGRISGAIQMIRPSANRQAAAFGAELDTFFVAPWAQGYGLGRSLLTIARDHAKSDGFKTLDLHVRGNRTAAINLFEKEGYKRWGTKQRYAKLPSENGLEDGSTEFVAGHFYTLDLDN